MITHKTRLQVQSSTATALLIYLTLLFVTVIDVSLTWLPGGQNTQLLFSLSVINLAMKKMQAKQVLKWFCHVFFCYSHSFIKLTGLGGA